MCWATLQEILSQSHLVTIPSYFQSDRNNEKLLKCCFSVVPEQGCQIFRGTIYQNGENIPNDHKIYQSALKYTKWPENGPNGHKIYKHRQLQDPPKFTQIGIFGLKVYHLATQYQSTEF
jgi:hypothetical protein